MFGLVRNQNGIPKEHGCLLWNIDDHQALWLLTFLFLSHTREKDTCKKIIQMWLFINSTIRRVKFSENLIVLDVSIDV